VESLLCWPCCGYIFKYFINCTLVKGKERDECGINVHLKNVAVLDLFLFIVNKCTGEISVGYDWLSLIVNMVIM